ncbi:hypothetical protein DYB28_007344 [Aphanomyces astaci]|nr:hypothetical protein DYB31_005300 [Aphanomyces astaci]RHZ13397.1 hypothetical protein DYB26_004325 [Aphanomyces astaci]RLO09147.1 hypothetical protein DYB28_007344 [Aphanomyces astaci]
MYMSAIQATIFDALYKSDSSRAWVFQALYDYQWGSVANEVAAWHTHGLTSFVCQSQNLYQYGIQDTITIVNSLNLEQSIRINEQKTLANLVGVEYVGPWNNLAICEAIWCSLVRQAGNVIDKIGISYDVDIIIGTIQPPTIDLVRENTFQDAFFRHLHLKTNAAIGDNDPRSNDYYLRSVEVDPVPSTWRGMLFAGGNPMYVYNDLVPFVQDSFGHNDACQVQKPFKVKLQPNSILLALRALPPPALELSVQACAYIWHIVVYSTVLLGAVGVCGPGLFQGESPCTSLNIYQFNRVAVSVWLGRPVLFLRGLAAHLVLSSASVELATCSTLTGFDPSPRSLYTVANLGGEATWITFVLHDLFVPFISTHEVSQVLTPCCMLVTLVVLAALELMSPVRATILSL